MSSLPVPVSPWISTVLFIGATSSSVEKSRCIVVSRPMMWSNRRRSGSTTSSSTSGTRCSESADFRTRVSCDSSNGLVRKSTAPRFMAVTASATSPKPGDDDGADLRIPDDGIAEHLHTVRVGQVQVNHHRVVREVLQPVDRVGRVDGLRGGESAGLE